MCVWVKGGDQIQVFVELLDSPRYYVKERDCGRDEGSGMDKTYLNRRCTYRCRQRTQKAKYGGPPPV